MGLILHGIHLAAGSGRLLLIAGLFVGITVPSMGSHLRSWLPEIVAVLMFLAAIRIGHRNAIGALKDLHRVSIVAVLYQLAIPLLFLASFAALELIETPLALAIILMAAASPISGGANLTIMVGGDPAPALRLLVISTALLPITIIPVFYFLPTIASTAGVILASAKLLLLILAASVLAFLLRTLFMKDPTQSAIKAVDGLSAITMAVLVIGLMSTVGTTLVDRPLEVAKWLGAAFVVNFGLQIFAYLIFDRTKLTNERVPFAISAGNRNIALFLVALPLAVTEPILLFIGCYQMPMYLTPVLLRKFYSK